MELLDYLDPDGRDLFDEWFTQLDPQARAKVTTHLIRLSRGNLSGIKGVGEGVWNERSIGGRGTASTSAATAKH